VTLVSAGGGIIGQHHMVTKIYLKQFKFKKIVYNETFVLVTIQT
jgi:hypothetical protein